jgi:hypothetical protein
VQGADGNQYVSDEYAIGADGDAYDDNDPSALTDFHGALDAHGTWTDDARYGTVWVPASAEVGADFQPYVSSGHWVVDDDDSYVWVSDYDWGWAPFHYGRWVWIDGSGWAWVPGREYAGAWVEWGWDDGYGYVGWYPLAPAFFWFGGVAIVSTYYFGPHWAYCGRGDVFAHNVGAHVVTGPAAGRIAANVHVAANPGVGPAPARLGYSGSAVPRVSAANNAGIAHAQSFSRPSTAVSMGGSAARPYAGSPGAHGAGGIGAGHAMGAMPGVQPGQQKTTTKKKGTTYGTPSHGSSRGGYGRGGGGFGGFRGGGGGGGGGGHHR